MEMRSMEGKERITPEGMEFFKMVLERESESWISLGDSLEVTISKCLDVNRATSRNM